MRSSASLAPPHARTVITTTRSSTTCTTRRYARNFIQLPIGALSARREIATGCRHNECIDAGLDIDVPPSAVALHVRGRITQDIPLPQILDDSVELLGELFGIGRKIRVAARQ